MDLKKIDNNATTNIINSKNDNTNSRKGTFPSLSNSSNQSNQVSPIKNKFFNKVFKSGLKQSLKKLVIKALYKNTLFNNKIFYGFVYSIVDVFQNKQFNMERLRVLDFTDLNNKIEENKVNYKVLSKQEKTEYLKKMLSLKGDIRNKKMNMIKALTCPGNEVLYFNVKSGCLGQDSIAEVGNIRYSNDEIDMAKKCLVNNWDYPPKSYLVQKAVEAEELAKSKNTNNQIDLKSSSNFNTGNLNAKLKKQNNRSNSNTSNLSNNQTNNLRKTTNNNNNTQATSKLNQQETDIPSNLNTSNNNDTSDVSFNNKKFKKKARFFKDKANNSVIKEIKEEESLAPMKKRNNNKSKNYMNGNIVIITHHINVDNLNTNAPAKKSNNIASNGSSPVYNYRKNTNTSSSPTNNNEFALNMVGGSNCNKSVINSNFNLGNNFNLSTAISKNPTFRSEGGQWIDPKSLFSLFTDLIVLHNKKCYFHSLCLNLSNISNDDILNFHRGRFVIKLSKVIDKKSICDVIDNYDNDEYNDVSLNNFKYINEDNEEFKVYDMNSIQYYDEGLIGNEAAIRNNQEANANNNLSKNKKDIKNKKNLSETLISNSQINTLLNDINFNFLPSEVYNTTDKEGSNDNNTDKNFSYSSTNKLIESLKDYTSDGKFFTNKINPENSSLLIQLQIKDEVSLNINNLGIFFELCSVENPLKPLYALRLKNNFSSYQLDTLNKNNEYYLIMKNGVFPCGYTLDLFSDHKLTLMSYEEYLVEAFRYYKKDVFCNYDFLTKGVFVHLRKFIIIIDLNDLNDNDINYKEDTNEDFDNNSNSDKYDDKNNISNSINGKNKVEFYFSINDKHIPEKIKNYIELTPISGIKDISKLPLNERVEVYIDETSTNNISKSTSHIKLNNNDNIKEENKHKANISELNKEILEDEKNSPIYNNNMYMNSINHNKREIEIAININPLHNYTKDSFNLSVYCNKNIEIKSETMITPYEVADKVELKKNYVIFQEMLFNSEPALAALNISFNELSSSTNSIENKYGYLFDENEEINNGNNGGNNSLNSRKIRGKPINKISNTQNIVNINNTAANKENSEVNNKSNKRIDDYPKPKIEFLLELLINNTVIKSWSFIDKITIYNLSLNKFSDTELPNINNQQKINNTKINNKTHQPNIAEFMTLTKQAYSLRCSLLPKSQDIALQFKQYSDVNKLFWIIRVFSNTTIAFVKDSRKEDKEQYIISQWEQEQKGRSEIASDTRIIFLLNERKERGEILSSNEEEFVSLNDKLLKRSKVITDLNSVSPINNHNNHNIANNKKKSTKQLATKVSNIKVNKYLSNSNNNQENVNNIKLLKIDSILNSYSNNPDNHISFYVKNYLNYSNQALRVAPSISSLSDINNENNNKLSHFSIGNNAFLSNSHCSQELTQYEFLKTMKTNNQSRMFNTNTTNYLNTSNNFNLTDRMNSKFNNNKISKSKLNSVYSYSSVNNIYNAIQSNSKNKTDNKGNNFNLSGGNNKKFLNTNYTNYTNSVINNSVYNNTYNNSSFYTIQNMNLSKSNNIIINNEPRMNNKISLINTGIDFFVSNQTNVEDDEVKNKEKTELDIKHFYEKFSNKRKKFNDTNLDSSRQVLRKNLEIKNESEEKILLCIDYLKHLISSSNKANLITSFQNNLLSIAESSKKVKSKASNKNILENEISISKISSILTEVFCNSKNNDINDNNLNNINSVSNNLSSENNLNKKDKNSNYLKNSDSVKKLNKNNTNNQSNKSLSNKNELPKINSKPEFLRLKEDNKENMLENININNIEKPLTVNQKKLNKIISYYSHYLEKEIEFILRKLNLVFDNAGINYKNYLLTTNIENELDKINRDTGELNLSAKSPSKLLASPAKLLSNFSFGDVKNKLKEYLNKNKRNSKDNLVDNDIETNKNRLENIESEYIRFNLEINVNLISEANAVVCFINEALEH